MKKLFEGYHRFRDKYAVGDQSIMQQLHDRGQEPNIMFVACSDSRVDPALILQCDPGELFVIRNVANIIPPYEHDTRHHGTSAGLEFGIRFLHIKQLIILGHSECGGIHALFDQQSLPENDFITSWVAIQKDACLSALTTTECAQRSLDQSYRNCLTFPWIQEKIQSNELSIDRWFFDIQTGRILYFHEHEQRYLPLEG